MSLIAFIVGELIFIEGAKARRRFETWDATMSRWWQGERNRGPRQGVHLNLLAVFLRPSIQSI
jgi:hypothetical protein